MTITNNSSHHFTAQEVAQIQAGIAARTVNAKQVIINPDRCILVLDSDVRLPISLQELLDLAPQEKASCRSCFWYILATEATPRQRDMAKSLEVGLTGEGICELNDYWTNPTLCRCAGNDYQLK